MLTAAATTSTRARAQLRQLPGETEDEWLERVLSQIKNDIQIFILV